MGTALDRGSGAGESKTPRQNDDREIPVLLAQALQHPALGVAIHVDVGDDRVEWLFSSKINCSLAVGRQIYRVAAGAQRARVAT